MTIELEIGKTYESRDGRIATIGGVTHEHPEWVWSVQGNWYERTTGRYIGYATEPAWPATPRSGQHVVSEPDHPNNLVRIRKT